MGENVATMKISIKKVNNVVIPTEPTAQLHKDDLRRLSGYLGVVGVC